MKADRNYHVLEEDPPWLDPRALHDLRDDADDFEDALTAERDASKLYLRPGFGQMVDQTASCRFLLVRLDQRHWVIQRQLSARVGDPVAHIRATADRDLEVVEVSWEFPTALPVRYATAEDVLSDIELRANRPHGATKPIPISHFPPPSTKTSPRPVGAHASTAHTVHF